MIKWKEIEIGDALTRNTRFEKRENEKQYVFAGIYSFSKGVLIREPVQGSSFKLPFIQRIKEGDFVYSKIMAWEGAFSLVPKDADNTVLSDAFVSYTINRKVVLPEFLEFYFKIESVWKQIGSKSTGTNMRRRTLHPKQFEKAKIRVPSLKEQKHIVDKLTCITDNLRKAWLNIREQEKEIVLLRQSILQEAIQGKLTPQVETDEPASELLKRIKAEKQKLIKEGKLKKEKEMTPISEEEIPFELPKGWVWCRLGNLVSTMNNGLYKPESFYKPSGTISLRMFNIQDGVIDLSTVRRVLLTDEEKSLYKLLKDDILINRVNSAELVGKAAIIPELEEDLVYESMNMRLQFMYKDEIAPYINLFLRTQTAKAHFTSNLKQAISQASINQTQVASLLIPLPPVQEQKKILIKVSQMMNYISQLESHVADNQVLTQLLLQTVLKEAFEENGKEYLNSESLTLAAEA